jgi:hypothetical protein
MRPYLPYAVTGAEVAPPVAKRVSAADRGVEMNIGIVSPSTPTVSASHTVRRGGRRVVNDVVICPMPLLLTA